ncbi:MAG TPA: hypothetical protein VEJ23_00125 [Solirubrobacteraceae bacterium]|nr:hypothetical protein [Solirubrobacteraceae bacterium]
MPDRRPPLKVITPDTSPEEAAAIMAAIERFARATARPEPQAAAADPWTRAAMLEGVARADRDDAREPWINT